MNIIDFILILCILIGIIYAYKRGFYMVLYETGAFVIAFFISFIVLRGLESLSMLISVIYFLAIVAILLFLKRLFYSFLRRLPGNKMFSFIPGLAIGFVGGLMLIIVVNRIFPEAVSRLIENSAVTGGLINILVK